MTKSFRTSLESSPFLAALDLIAVHVSALLAIALGAPSQRPENLRIYAHILLPLSILAILSFSLSSLYRTWSRRPLINLGSTLLLAECLYITAWMSMNGWQPRWAISRSVIAASAVLQLFFLAAGRMLIRRLARTSDQSITGIMTGAIVAEDLAHAHAVRREISTSSPSLPSPCACLSAEEFLGLSDHQIPWNAVLVAEDVRDKAAIIRRASHLRKNIFIIPGILELWMVGAHTVKLDDLLMLRLTPPHLRPSQRAVKRLFDVAGSLCLLILAAPLILVAVILIRLSSPGPVLFRQTRVGADGKEYVLMKLRSMIVDAEQHTGPVLASRNDPRITKIGRLLRATRIDELPQLINVLVGNMSLIGPRPERPHFVRIFAQQLPGYEFRMAVKPGITGLAQIYGRYSTTPERKLRFDLMYIYNYSLLMDLQILLKTILAVVQPGNAEGLEDNPIAPALGSDALGSDD